MGDPDAWKRLIECIICLEPTLQPVRPWHQPPRFSDCGVVLCPARGRTQCKGAPLRVRECFDRWRHMAQPVCPKCRADVVFLGVSADGPLVGGAGLPDPLLVRLLAELPPGTLPAPSPSPKETDADVSSTTGDRSPRLPERRLPDAFGPIPQSAIAAMLRRLHPSNERRPWTDTIVTSTTLLVDDDEAARLYLCTSRPAVADLDLRLGWSRRLGFARDSTPSCLAHFAHLTGGSPDTAEWNDAWLHTQAATVDIRGLRFLRILVAALVALVRWCRDHHREEPRAHEWHERLRPWRA